MGAQGYGEKDLEKRGIMMDLGTFSVSLTVKDMKASKEFYQKLGFEKIAGVEEQNWLILKNGDAKIGLFHGMFDKNLMTMNPLDVRSIQKTLKENGVEFLTEADETTEGPASAMLSDPDGNTILLDQH